jgi:hypothetical protein
VAEEVQLLEPRLDDQPGRLTVGVQLPVAAGIGIRRVIHPLLVNV